MELQVPAGTDVVRREVALGRWYRTQLRTQLPGLVTKWQERMGVEVAEVRIKKMKTRWGSCNTVARRIWLNVELAKKPLSCVEYILVHEMVHLVERRHNERFRELMDRHLPNWRLIRAELNRAPLAHEDWRY
jgi:predicted metal-dependent hydrolase